MKLLWKEKAFTATAVATLALCIGANTAIFTVLNAVILEPLPFPDSGRLVTLYNIYPGVGVTDHGANGVPDYLDRKKMTDVFDSVALLGGSGYDVGSQGSPVRIEGEHVTPSYFRVLRASPMLGRAFTEDDAVFGKEKFAILSFGLWKERFAGDRNVLGKDIRLSGVPYRIVGVMPESFEPPRSEARIWVPFAFEPRQTADDARHSNSWGMVARLKPGVTVEYARQRIDALNRRNLDLFPKYRRILEDAKFATKVVGLQEELVRDVKPTLLLLQAAVSFVLLIGCVNVANLMLVRSNVRMKELAIRFTMGAGRLRLGRQLLTESVTLALIGGLAGVFTGWAGVRLLTYLGAKELPRGTAIAIDGSVLAFSAGIAILTGLIFGSIPVYNLFRRDLNAIFRQSERGGTSVRSALWTRSALVVSQVALAFVLLIGSTLLTLSFARLLTVSPGFQPERVFTAAISLPSSRYKELPARRTYINGLLDSVRAIPGVSTAGITNFMPFSGDMNSSVISIPGRALAPGETPPVPVWTTADAGYLPALRVNLLQGRNFTRADSADAPKAIIIDQYLARKYWPKGDAIGAKIKRGLDADSDICTIVGVVATIKTGDLAEQNAVGQVYFAAEQYPPRDMHLVVKTSRDDAQLAGALRQAVLKGDPELALFDVKTMPERLSASVRNRRAAMVICLVFAGLALLLSAIGIYGVLAYAVTQRMREFGIRLALGAGARELIGMVVGQGIRLAVIGLALGIACAFLLTRLMEAMLYQVKPSDPGVFLGVAVALLAIACIASLIPSLRAIRIRPASALRYE